MKASESQSGGEWADDRVQCGGIIITDGLQLMWLCGRRYPDSRPWEVLGIYHLEELAVARCREWFDFVAPLPFGVDLPEHTIEWPGAYYPSQRLEAEHEAAHGSPKPQADDSGTAFASP